MAEGRGNGGGAREWRDGGPPLPPVHAVHKVHTLESRNDEVGHRNGRVGAREWAAISARRFPRQCVAEKGMG